MKQIFLLLLVFINLFSFSQDAETIELGKFRDNSKPSTKLNFNEKMNNYDVVYYGLNIEATNTTSSISSAIVTIKAKVVASPLSEFVIQLINQLLVSKVKLNGQDISFIHQNDEISFFCPLSLSIGDYFSVEIHYSGTPQGGGWSKSNDYSWNIPVTWTLSESFHAYEWFPVKQLLTDKADSADIYVTVPSYLEVASNGILKKIVDLSGGQKRYEWQSRYPIDYYLISVTISDYIEYNTYANPSGLGEPLLIQNFVYNASGCLNQYKSTIDGTAEIIELFSSLFGMYPFFEEKYGHVMAPFGGGMEHQTMTTLGYFSNGLIAHELAHMWFGDYVTCGTWQDIWINEGFASYAEYLNLQNLNSQSSADYWIVSAQNSAKQKPYGSVYLSVAEAEDENRIFSSQLSYKKGACIIHMLRNEINNDILFFNILKQFLQRYRHSTATGDNFKTIVNELTGQDYTWYFDQWYYGYGYPTYSIQYGFTDNKPWVTISQTSSSTLTPFFKTTMDLKLTHYDNSNSTQRIFIAENQQTFTFDVPKIKSLQIDPNRWLLYQTGSITSNEVLYSNDLWASIGPNPFNDKILFNISTDSQMVRVTVSDMTGNELSNSTFSIQQFELDVQKLPKGIYIVTVHDGNRFSTRKMVKE